MRSVSWKNKGKHFLQRKSLYKWYNSNMSFYIWGNWGLERLCQQSSRNYSYLYLLALSPFQFILDGKLNSLLGGVNFVVSFGKLCFLFETCQRLRLYLETPFSYICLMISWNSSPWRKIKEHQMESHNFGIY